MDQAKQELLELVEHTEKMVGEILDCIEPLKATVANTTPEAIAKRVEEFKEMVPKDGAELPDSMRDALANLFVKNAASYELTHGIASAQVVALDVAKAGLKIQMDQLKGMIETFC